MFSTNCCIAQVVSGYEGAFMLVERGRERERGKWTTVDFYEARLELCPSSSGVNGYIVGLSRESHNA